LSIVLLDLIIVYLHGKFGTDYNVDFISKLEYVIYQNETGWLSRA